MTAAVIADLVARGVVLELHDGRLRAGPPGAMTADVRALIARHRDGIKAAMVKPAPDWLTREQAAIAQWRREWAEVWEGWKRYLAANPGWRPPVPYELTCQIHERVRTWNTVTGQQRHGDEVLATLCSADFSDRELMNPGALALYVGTVLRASPFEENADR